MNKEVELKLKELKEALEVINKIEEQVSWACDFTSFACIARALEPVYEAVDEAKSNLNHELDFLELKIEEYNDKLADFEFDNRIEV